MSSPQDWNVLRGPPAPHGLGATIRTGLAPLRIRDFRLYYLGQLFSTCGTWMQDVALIWLTWRVTHNQFLVGLVTACRYSAALLLTIPAAAAADRFSRRTILLAANTLALVAAGLFGCVALAPSPAIWQMCVLFALTGVATAFELPTRHAFLASLVPPKLIPEAVTLNAVSFNCARVVGPGLAGLLIADPHITVAGCCFINAASYIGVIAALLLVRRDARTPKKTDTSVTAGIRHAAASPPIAHALLLAFAVGIFGWSIPIVLPSFVEHVMHGASALYGRLVASAGFGALCGACCLSVGMAPQRTRLYQYGGLVCWIAALAALSCSAHAIPALLLMWAAGFGMVVFSTTTNSILQLAVPGELRARVMGLWALVYLAAEPIGGVATGTLAKYLGTVEAIRIAAAAMATAALIGFIAERGAITALPQNSPQGRYL